MLLKLKENSVVLRVKILLHYKTFKTIFQLFDIEVDQQTNFFFR